MQILETNAYAKINLALCITGRRSDGYHQLDMLMQSIDLHDTLTFTAQSGLTLEVATDAAAGINTAGIPVGADNLILRAAERMQKAFHHKHTQEPLPGAHIRLVKRIPMAAGLAGGSADAAATLLALNELWQAGLGTLTLCRIGAELGADIPYCL
ncbi:MAG: 4-(cytidine 5'-diphospho)-2-C-methyl-D-erythritol kinase, partial [Butyrivibrio sp.]|nr:4-(cytidine 5'-diphospho)-2-C-methyl-D-erythritol kinase [Butyrivibrio sp.]